jgi:hypothetical protein
MTRSGFLPGGLLLLAGLGACAQDSANPRVFTSVPANGARDVRPDVGRIVVTFDRDMKAGSHSLLEAPGTAFPPVAADAVRWEGPRTFVLPVGPLKPGASYAIQLNSEQRKGFVSAVGEAPLSPTTIAFTVAAGGSGGGGGKPLTVVLRRQWEPKQRAFSVLVPQGWQTEGGVYAVDPGTSGGTLNAVDSKCDFSVKRDAAGSVMARWVPSINYVDFSQGAEYANAAALFPPGRIYNGGLVRPLPAVGDLLMDLVTRARPRAERIRVVQKAPLPELADVCQSLTRGVNAQIAQLGKRPMAFTAGVLVLEYEEGGTAYREGIGGALCDVRNAAAIWSNQFTFHMRAPAAEADAWKPLLDIVRQSLRFNPEWVTAYQKASAERGETAAEVFRTLARIDQEIFDRRSKVRSEVQNDNYLMLTGQEEYVNPFTKEVERDTADYKFRWTNASGDRLYTSRQDVDPNRDPELGKVEWKVTPPRPR